MPCLWKNTPVMSTQKTITLHLDEREYEQLEAAARRKGMEPAALLRSLVDDVLDDVLDDPERRKQAMNDALEALDRLAATMPPFDVEKLVREGRDELDQRSMH